MNFVDPKVDFAFKKIFGNQERIELLIDFLNALLYEGDRVIKDGLIIDPYQDFKNASLHHQPLIVNAQLEGDRICLIEVQILNLPTFGKRALYQAAKTYALQLNKGIKNPEIKPVMALNLADFELFEEQDHFISRFALKEVDKFFDYPNNELGLFFVELPKFKKELGALETLGDKWLYFIKNAADLETVPTPLAEIETIVKAFNWANEDNLTREEYEFLQQQIFFIEDQRSSMLVGQERGLQEGLQQGLKEGMEVGKQQGREVGIQQGLEKGKEEGIKVGIEQGKQEGIVQGKQEGIQEGQLTIIQRLLKRRFVNLDPEVGDRVTKLSREQLENLAEAVWDFITESELKEWLDDQSP